MRIAFGMIDPDEGEIRLEGVPVGLHLAADAIAAGIEMVHQHFMLVPAMTVAENVELGDRGRYDAHESANRVRWLAKETGLSLGPLARVCSLSIAKQQRLETIKALARDRGFIAIAIVVLGHWHPAGVTLAALIFGTASALQYLFETMSWNPPYQVFLALPYLLTLLALAGVAGRVHAPANLGKWIESR